MNRSSRRYYFYRKAPGWLKLAAWQLSFIIHNSEEKHYWILVRWSIKPNLSLHIFTYALFFEITVYKLTLNQTARTVAFTNDFHLYQVYWVIDKLLLCSIVHWTETRKSTYRKLWTARSISRTAGSDYIAEWAWRRLQIRLLWSA